MRKFGINSASLLALAYSAAAVSSTALAQDSTPAPSRVERIVVTAEKRAEDPQTAPIAVTVFDEGGLRRNNIDEIDDLEFATPSLTVATAGQANMMNLRGIGKFDAGGTSTSAVATYRDGVGTVSGFFNHEPYYDIESVEVLRGPQGTYIGENAAGGAIFVNTRDPVVGGDFEGYLQGGIGNYETREVQGAINIPLGNKMAARISARHVDRDSFFDVFTDPAGTTPHPSHPGDIDHNSLRFGLAVEPTEQLSILFKLDMHRLDHGGNVFGTVPGFDLVGASQPNISDDLYTVGNNYLGVFYRDKMARGILEVNYDFEDGSTVHWISGIQYINTHIRNDDDGSAYIDLQQIIRPIFRVYTSEATYVSPEDERFRWLLGAFFRREVLWFPENEGFYLYSDPDLGGPAAPELILDLDWRIPRQTEAIYGQVAYDLTDSLEIVAGVRGQHYRAKQRADLGLYPPFFGGFPLTLHLVRNSTYDEDAFTYKVALNWKATEEHYFYAFVATGNTTGGQTVVQSANPLDFGPQKTTDFEAGWKGTLMDGQLLTQFGGFYTLIDDFQVNFEQIGGLGLGGFQNLRGTTKSYGIELQTQAKIDDIGVDFNAAWVHSELADGLVQISDLVLPTPVQTGGKPLPWSPEFQVNVGVEYDFHLGGDMTLTPRATYSWVDEQTVETVDRVFMGIPLDRIFAHEIVNFQLTLATEDWLVQAYLTNAFEEQYIQAHSGNPDDPDAYANEPQRYGLRVTKNF